MDFRILGPLDVDDADRSLALGGEKQRSLLALLLLHRGELLSSDRLIDELWGERPPTTAAKNIHVYVSRLRKALGDGLLETCGHGYRLVIEPEQVDAARFERLLAEGRRAADAGDADGAVARLRDALALWRGPPLADLAYEPFAQSEIVRLEELRLAAVEELVAAELDLGRHAELVPQLEALVRDHPLRERLLGQLMLALYRCGRQTEALERYRHGRRALLDEQGLEPGPALRELEHAILAQDAALAAPARAPTPPPAATGNGRPEPGVRAVEPTNPYRGLRAFAEADAPNFFGRDALIEKLVAKLAATRFLAVVGPSGSGKSSVVRAGLVPRLRGGALPGSERWHVIELFPGARPLEELEAALLRIAVNPPASLLEQLAGDERGLLRAVKRALPADESELVLFIDQLEELFTLVEDEARRTHVLALIEAAVADPDSRIRVVATLRADFYDRPLRYRGFAELLSEHAEAVLPLTPKELERAIAGPAERAGMTFEQGLVAELVADVADEPGALPQLQYALTELFERRDRTTLTRAAYRAIGGASGALAGRADETYASLGPSGQEAARQLFLRLVTLGEGIEDARRRVERAELAAVEVDQEAMAAAVEAFGIARMLAFDRDPRTGAPTVEVAHEALLREWRRLRTWIDAARDDVRTHRRLAAEAAEWQDSGRDASFLLRGGRLEHFEPWAGASELAPTALERAYIGQSVQARDSERAAEELRSAREAMLERRSLRRARALVVVLAVAAAVAAVLTIVAFHQSDRSKRQARLAAARELVAASVASVDEDPERGILLALQAVAAYRSIGDAVPSTAVEALHRTVAASRVRLTLRGAAGHAGLDSAGRLVATGAFARPLRPGDARQGQVVLWDARSGRRALRLPAQPEGIGDVQLSPDGSRVAAVVGGGAIQVWNARTGRQLLTLAGGAPRELAFSPDGTRLAATGAGITSIGATIADASARLTIWDARTGRRALAIAARSPLCGVAFSPSGRQIAAGGCLYGDRATVWDARTGTRLRDVGVGLGPVNDVAFSPDGSRLATVGTEGIGRIWSVATGRRLAVLRGHTGWIYSVSFSPDGRRVATGGRDDTARLWDAHTGRQLLVLTGHAAAINDVQFSPDGARLLTGGEDGARIWDVSPGGGEETLTVAAHRGPRGAAAVDYNHDGTRLVSAGSRPAAELRDVATGRRLWSLRHAGELRQAAFSPDGRRILLSGYGTPLVVDAASARVRVRLTRPLDVRLRGAQGPSVIAFSPGATWSPDGREIALGSFDGLVTIWDASSGRLLRSFGHLFAAFPGDSTVSGVAFSPDGTLLATSSWDWTARIWDVASGRLLATLADHADLVNSVRFSRDGKRLLTGSSDGTAKIWDVRSGRLLVTLGARTRLGAVWDAEFSPDDRLVATAGDDSTARLWDAATGAELLELTGTRFAIHHVAFSPDGRRLATASGDGTLHVFLLRLDDLVVLARRRVTRQLTTDECRRYLHARRCPAPA